MQDRKDILNVGDIFERPSPEIFRHQPVGSWILRKSSQPGFLSISVKISETSLSNVRFHFNGEKWVPARVGCGCIRREDKNIQNGITTKVLYPFFVITETGFYYQATQTAELEMLTREDYLIKSLDYWFSKEIEIAKEHRVNLENAICNNNEINQLIEIHKKIILLEKGEIEQLSDEHLKRIRKIFNFDPELKPLPEYINSPIETRLNFLLKTGGQLQADKASDIIKDGKLVQGAQLLELIESQSDGRVKRERLIVPVLEKTVESEYSVLTGFSGRLFNTIHAQAVKNSHVLTRFDSFPHN